MASEWHNPPQYREAPAAAAGRDRVDEFLYADTRRRHLQESRDRLGPALYGMRGELSGADAGLGVELPSPDSFRMPKRVGVPSIDNGEQSVHGLEPGYGPGVTASQIEREFGTLEQQPGWINAEQYEKATTASGLPSEKSRFLMTPERYDYMQNYGRAVDLLGGLQTSRSADGRSPVGRTAISDSIHYWDKSDPERTGRMREGEFLKANPQLSRNDYWDPNYQRFSGADRAALEFMGDPTSAVATYLNQSEILPNILRFSAMSPHPAASAAALHKFRDRFRLGDTPVMDLPEIPGEDAASKAERFQRREQEVQGILRNLATPSPQYVANKVLGGDATPAASFALDTILSALDPTMVSGFTAGLARRLMDPRNVGRSVLSNLARSTGGETFDQAWPEYAFAAGIHPLTNSEPNRTHADFYSSPAGAEERDIDAHSEAVRQMEIMDQARPQSISARRTYGPPPPKRLESLDGFSPFML